MEAAFLDWKLFCIPSLLKTSYLALFELLTLFCYIYLYYLIQPIRIYLYIVMHLRKALEFYLEFIFQDDFIELQFPPFYRLLTLPFHFPVSPHLEYLCNLLVLTQLLYHFSSSYSSELSSPPISMRPLTNLAESSDDDHIQSILPSLSKTVCNEASIRPLSSSVNTTTNRSSYILTMSKDPIFLFMTFKILSAQSGRSSCTRRATTLALIWWRIPFLVISTKGAALHTSLLAYRRQPKSLEWRLQPNHYTLQPINSCDGHLTQDWPALLPCKTPPQSSHHSSRGRRYFAGWTHWVQWNFEHVLCSGALGLNARWQSDRAGYLSSVGGVEVRSQVHRRTSEIYRIRYSVKELSTEQVTSHLCAI